MGMNLLRKSYHLHGVINLWDGTHDSILLLYSTSHLMLVQLCYMCTFWHIKKGKNK